jgi:hypothetical protein
MVKKDKIDYLFFKMKKGFVKTIKKCYNIHA